MKPWIKRTLIGLAATGALLGGLAAWAYKEYRQHVGWHVVSEQQAAPIKARVIEMAGRRLDLDAAQKAKLGLLADALREQRNALVTQSADPKTELQGLIAGNTFDRARAQTLVTQTLVTVNSKSPALLAATADFYDSLNPAQQAKLREMLAKHRPHRGERGVRGSEAARSERGG